jgi:outer membrane protein TolC
MLLPGLELVSALPAQEGRLTVSQAVKASLEKHPDIGKQVAQADILRGQVREVRAQALPELTITSSMMRWRDPSLLNASGLDKFPPELISVLVPVPVNLVDYGIGLKQPLYTAGKVGTALKLASIESEGATIDIDRAQHDLALEVVKAFYRLLLAGRYRQLIDEIHEQRKQQAELARTRYQHGVATEVEALRFDVAVANSAVEVVEAQNNIRQARAQLNYYLVRSIDEPTEIEGDFMQIPWDEWNLAELEKEAIRRRPDLHRLRVAERSAQTRVDLAKAESKMRLDFNGNVGITSRYASNLANPDYGRWNVGVNFSLPVFDGFRRSGLVWQATAAQRATGLEREKAEQQVRLQLQQGLDAIRAANETITAARASVNQGERVFSMTQNNYKYGAASVLDLLDAQLALLLARTNLLRGQHADTIARATLRWTLGRTPWE